LQNFFEQLEHVWPVAALGTTPILYASISVLHYFTIFLLVGSVAVVDLRVLGVLARTRRLVQLAEEIFPLMWTFLTIALVTGFLLFLTDGGDYYPDKWFRFKMLVILLAIVSIIFVRRNVDAWDRQPRMPAVAKFAAAVSLLLWLGAILAGVDIAALSGLG
jgi:hypothetical protein